MDHDEQHDECIHVQTVPSRFSSLQLCATSADVRTSADRKGC